MPKKKKDKTIPQLEKHIQETEEEKKQIHKFTEMHIEKPKRNYGLWMVFAVCVVLLAIGELERARLLTIIAGFGFIFLIVTYISKKLMEE